METTSFRLTRLCCVPTVGMRQRMQVAFCLTVLLSPALAGLPGNIGEPSQKSSSCHRELNRLVAYLKETAGIEGMSLGIV
jgi:hypothetical protein